MAEPKWLQDMNSEEYLKEDFNAQGKAKAGTTVDGIEKNDPDWFNKATKKVNAAEGNDYIKLDAGLLTVNQLNWMLRNTIGEMTFVDDNNQFLWYNRPLDPNYKMLAGRKPEQVGDTMGAGLLEKKVNIVQAIILWLICWLGNLVGAVLLSWIFTASGLDLPLVAAAFTKAAAAKMSAPAVQLVYEVFYVIS